MFLFQKPEYKYMEMCFILGRVDTKPKTHLFG